jgi:hypothetical protein
MAMLVSSNRQQAEKSRTMSDITTSHDQTEVEIFNEEVSDESLEATAFAGNSGAYTEFAFCTMGGCPL